MFKHSRQFVILCAFIALSACTASPPKDEPTQAGINQQLFQKAKSAYLSGDFKTAAALFDNLAQNGDHEAQYSLGYMYYYAKGVTRDLDKAMYWFKVAASQGNPEAKQALITINKRIAEQKQADTATSASSTAANTPPGVIDLRASSATKTHPAPVKTKPEMKEILPTQPRPVSPTPAPVQQAQKTTPVSTASDSIKINTNAAPLSAQERASKEWIMNQPAKHYTIQMTSTTQAANAQRLQKKLSAVNSHYFRARVKDKLRFSVIYGSYDTYTKARQQQQAFKQQGYRDTWIRSMESIQQIIR